MNSTSMPRRGNLFSRSALGLALAFGVASGALVAQPAIAAKKEKDAGPKIEFSSEFAKAAAELDKSLAESSKNAEAQAAVQQVRAAKDPAAKAAAVAQVDAALGGAKAKLDSATVAATTPGDKLKLGEMMHTYAVMTGDPALQHRGAVMMLDSGVLPAASQGRLQWVAGVTAYQNRDFATAARYLQQAKDGGFQDPQLEAVLVDSYNRSNNPAAALQNAQRDIAAATAAGTKPSEMSIQTALQAAYNGKQVGPATDLAVMLVDDYPTVRNWNSSIGVVRQLLGYQPQEMLDLMRLMGRTGSYGDETDYVEYLQAIDPRRLPGEAQAVIQSGTAAGKLSGGHPFVVEARKIASERIAEDRASLPGLDRSARAGSASAAAVVGAADAFLSYGEPAKAEELYKIALTKPGVDAQRVLTRLGIAQADQGKAAEAQATFAKVEGPRKPIARLWSAYASNKAAGGAAPVASAQ